MLKKNSKIQLNIDSEYQDFLSYKYNLNKIDYDTKKKKVYKRYKRSKKIIKVGFFVSLMFWLLPGFLQYNNIFILASFYPFLLMSTFVGCITAFFSLNAVENIYNYRKHILDKEMSYRIIEKDIMNYINEKYGKDFIEFLLIKYKMEIPYAIIKDIEKEKKDMIEHNNIQNKAKIISNEIYEDYLKN